MTNEWEWVDGFRVPVKVNQLKWWSIADGGVFSDTSNERCDNKNGYEMKNIAGSRKQTTDMR